MKKRKISKVYKFSERQVLYTVHRKCVKSMLSTLPNLFGIIIDPLVNWTGYIVKFILMGTWSFGNIEAYWFLASYKIHIVICTLNFCPALESDLHC